MIITELIAALEAATDGGWELDWQVALAIGWTYEAWPEGRERKLWWRAPGTPRNEWFRRYKHPPKFSRSFDAALTLVPEGWMLDHLGHDAVGEIGKLKVIGGTAEITNGPFGDVPGGFQGIAPTLPLALCIAALKARQS